MSATTTQFQDQTLTCKDCGNQFVWTGDEQAFYESKGFKNAPVRCPDCRQKKREKFKRERVLTQITCAECGKQDTVPFKPKGDRPVLCADCFKKHKDEEAGKHAESPSQEAQQAPEATEEAPAVSEAPSEDAAQAPEEKPAEERRR